MNTIKCLPIICWGFNPVRGRSSPLPCGCAASFLVMRGLGRVSTWGRPYKRSDPCPLIRHGFAVPPSPPRGRFRRRRIRTGSVGSAKPGAVVKPHQRQFLQTQGPVAREESRKATPFLRAGNDAQSLRSASSVTGDRGKAEPSPGDSLVTFSSLRKSLAAGAAKFSPHSLKGNEKRRRGQAPALPRICALTCPLIRPLRGHFPPRGKAINIRTTIPI